MTTTPITRRGPRLLAVDDVAEQLAVSTKTVRRWIKRGDLHVHRLGRLHRVAEDDLRLFLGKARINAP
jgi:excisionase family DNA binding protein